MSLIVETLQLRPDDTPSSFEPKPRMSRLAKMARYMLGSVELSPARIQRWRALAGAAMEHFEQSNPQRDVYHVGEYYDAADLYSSLSDNRSRIARRTLARGAAAVRAHRASLPAEE